MFSFNKLPLILTTAVTAFTLQSTHAQTDTFCDYLQGDGNFTFLFEALNSTGLCDALDNLDKGTLFAPTNEAFDALNASQPEVVECLSNETNADALTDILLFHVTKSELDSKTLTSVDPGTTFETLLDGETISVNSTDGKLIINDNSTVEEPFDVDIVNGEHSYLFLTCFIYICSLPNVFSNVPM